MSKPLVITHSGGFQPDDVFAVAVLRLVLGEIYIVRSRDPEIIKTGDYVVDVGTKYDPSLNLFDHHQEGGAGKRDNGIPYSSIGLAWKEFGEKLSGSKAVADIVDERLIQSLDAHDNGVQLFETKSEVYPYLLDDAFLSLSPTYEEGAEKADPYFLKAVDFAETILLREIAYAKELLEGKALVEEAYEKAEDKRIIVLERPVSSSQILNRYKEPLFVIKKEESSGNWMVSALRKHPRQFESRKMFPESWAGKRDDNLASISGVSDAFFCHNKRFIAGARSKEGAIALAKAALEE